MRLVPSSNTLFLKSSWSQEWHFPVAYSVTVAALAVAAGSHQIPWQHLRATNSFITAHQSSLEPDHVMHLDNAEEVN